MQFKYDNIWISIKNRVDNLYNDCRRETNYENNFYFGKWKARVMSAISSLDIPSGSNPIDLQLT